MDIFDQVSENKDTNETVSDKGDIFDRLSDKGDKGIFSKAVSLATTGANIINQTLAGTVETGASLATGMVSMPASGISMIAGLVAKGDINKAIEWGETTSDYLTYKPSSRYGKVYTEVANKVMGIPSQGIREGGEFLVEHGMDPAAATIVTAPLELAVYALLFKGARGVFPKGYDPAKISPADMLKAEKALDDFYGKTGSDLIRREPITGEASKAPLPEPLKTQFQPGEELPSIINKIETTKAVEQKSSEAALDEAFKVEQGKIGEPLIQREPVLGEMSKPPKPMSVKERLRSEEGSITVEKVKPEDLLPVITSLQRPGQPRALVSITELRDQVGMPPKDFDAQLFALAREGKVALHKHDSPFSLSEEARNKLLVEEQPGAYHEGKNYYVGVVPKEASVSKEKGKLLSEEGFIDLETFKKAGRSVKEFFIPFSSIPNKDQILLERYRTIGQIDRSEQYIKGIFNKLDRFTDDVKGDIFKYLDGQIPLNNLPTEAQIISKNLQTDTKAIGGLLVQRDIISQETFDNLKGRYVHYLYAKHILGEDNPIGVSPTGKLNLSYSKHRQDLTVDERKALGLIEDAQIAVPVGMGKALTDIAKYDYMDFLSRNPDATWQPSIAQVPLRQGQPPVKMGIGQLVEEVKTYEKMVKELSSPEVDARYNILKTSLDQAIQQTKNLPPDFIQLPVSKTYGPLSGAFVKKPIADDLMPIMNSIKNRGKLFETLVNVEQQGMAYFKMAKVALNIPTATRNIVSNILQNNMRGRSLTNIPGDIVNATKSMLGKDGFYTEAQKHGIFKTSWAATEIKEILNQFSKAKGGTYAEILDAVKNVAKYYGRIDDVSKFAIFRQLRVDGLPVEVATLEAQKWGMDYSLASRSVKHLRQHIVPFLSYQYKIAPLIAESLAKRPWVIGKYMAIPLIAKAMTTEMNDMKDSDWDKLQKQLPFYIKNSNSYMVMPGKSPSGNYQWVNYSYFLPWGNYLQAYEGLSNKDMGQVINSVGISNPFLDMITMFKSAKGDDPPKHSFTGQPLYNRLDPPHVKAAKVVEALGSTFIPPMLTRQGAVGYTYSAAVGGKDKWGKEITSGQALGRWFGVNITETTPKQTAVIKKSMEKEIRSDLYKITVDPTKSLKEKHDAQEKARQQIKEIYK